MKLKSILLQKISNFTKKHKAKVKKLLQCLLFNQKDLESKKLRIRLQFIP